MGQYQIAVLPGDGIGYEVIEATMPVLDRLGFQAEYHFGDIGWEFWCQDGEPLPSRTMDLLKRTDACLFGAITSKSKDLAEAELRSDLQGKGLAYSSPLLQLRQGLNLHTNLRPCRTYPGTDGNSESDIDIVVFRENSEDLYVGVEFHPLKEKLGQTLAQANPKMERFTKLAPEDVAVALRVISRPACRSIAQQAFKYAKANGYKRVSLTEKANVLQKTGGMMVEEVRRVAADYPGITYDEFHIDAMTMHLVREPESFGVIVASNLFGDIVSDLCSQLAGGIGYAPSANLGDDYAVFEPIHGSAPDIAGQGVANPLGMIFSAQMMLDWLGEKDLAERLKSAAIRVIMEGRVKTRDMGGSHGTVAMAQAVAECL